jgi:hypothetical protein
VILFEGAPNAGSGVAKKVWRKPIRVRANAETNLWPQAGTTTIDVGLVAQLSIINLPPYVFLTVYGTN